jgi:hypothetical protein
MPSSASSSAGSASSLRAELSSIGGTVDDLRQRVAGLATPLGGSDRDDLIAAIYEAERGLQAAARHLERATRLAR